MRNGDHNISLIICKFNSPITILKGVFFLDKVSIEEAVEEFVFHLEDQAKSSETIYAYRGDLKQLVDFLNNNNLPKTVQEIRPIFIRQIVRHFRRDLGFAPSTAERKLNCYRSFFKFCCQQEWTISNPAQAVDAPKKSKKLPVYLSDNEAERIIKAADNASHYLALRDRVMIKLLLTTGVRRSELMGLNWKDVDFKNKTILVRGKGDKERVVPLKDEVLTDMWLYLQSRLPLKNEAFLLSRQGNRLSIYAISLAINRCAMAAGIEKRVTCHSFRHTCATMLIHAGVNIKTTGSILGHEDVQTTLKYLHSSDMQNKTAIEEMSFPGIPNEPRSNV